MVQVKQTAEKRKNATNLNIQERITKFHDILSDEPLKYFTDIGKINFPVKIDFLDLNFILKLK